MIVEGLPEPSKDDSLQEEHLEISIKREEEDIKDEPIQETVYYNPMDYLDSAQEDVAYIDEDATNEEEFHYILQKPRRLKKPFKRFDKWFPGI